MNNRLGELWRRLQFLFHRRQFDCDLEEEIRLHLEHRTEESEYGSPEEARYAARRQFGNPTQIKETSRELWGWRWLENFWQDVRYGFRQLRRNPGFTAIAVLTLALGIGANTMIFSVVNAVLLRPLPFSEPDRLVRVWESRPKDGYFRNVVNGLNFLDWRDRNHSFEAIAAITDTPMNLTGAGEPQALPGLMVSQEFFSILRVSPLIGRTFLPEEGIPGRHHSIVLSYGFWQRQFGGDKTILGKKITVNGDPCTVVGVMPPGFSLPKQKADLWMPFPLARTERAWLGGRYLSTIARLKPGVTLTQAQEEMSAIGKQLEQERPAVNKDWSAAVVPCLEDATEGVRLPLLVLLAAVGFVLLIACANVANLLLMRANGRLREVAVRVALGAGRKRILQQFLIESLLLAMAGCIAGVAVAYWGLKGLLALIPAKMPLPRVESIHLDSSVFLFALGVSLLTVVLFGFVPAIQVSGLKLQDSLKQGSLRTGVGGGRVLRHAFVVTEVALSLLLLVGAGLMVRSFQNIISVNPGFSAERVLTMQIFTSPAQYSDDRKRSQYLEQVLTEIRTLPSVQAAGSIHFLPLTGTVSGSNFSRADRPAPPPGASPDADFLVITPGYFQAIGTPMLSGRNFNGRDRFGSPTSIVVNQAFVRRFFPGEDPIGKHLNFGWSIVSKGEIVGVVADARQTELQKDPQPTIFLANAQAPMYFANLVIRTLDEPRQFARAAQVAIHRVNPEQAISGIQTMREVFSNSVAEPRFQFVLLLSFAALAALMATIGVYGVVSYSVNQRTQEIGIRMALGALNRDVARLVLREGLVLAAIGIAIGLAGALALTRLLKSLLFEVTPTDPITLGLVSCLLLLVALAATYLPARRAARIDPMVALRYE